MKIKTEYPICFESLDYTAPIGAVNDDNSNPLYADEVESLFGRKISYLELGCAGATFIDLMVSKGHDAYGIDGTDHPLKVRRNAWEKYYDTRLFTCDLSKPFEILDAPKFDVVSAWEFMEHIPTDSLNFIMAKIYNMLDENGIVIFGISMAVTEHHLSVFPEKKWNEEIFSKLFIVNEYTLKNKYREDYIGDHKSFFTILKPKSGLTEIANDIIKEHGNKTFKKN
tara:strand:- start:12618 stop:13292 length:675 start_codon:yes stop_codon:yes gene_type:complete